MSPIPAIVRLGSILLLGCLPLLVSAETPTPAPSPWPMHQHDAAHTGRSSLHGIARAPQMLWRQRIAQRFEGAFSSHLSMSPTGSVYAFVNAEMLEVDPDDGSVLWSSQPKLEYGLGSSTPAFTADGRFFFGIDDRFVQFDADNTLLGGYGDLSSNQSFNSSPVIGPDGSVYMVHEGLWAFAPDGTFRWVYPFGDWSSNSPAVAADGTIYTGSGDGNLYAFWPDGVVKWKRPIGAYSSSPSIGADGTVYTGTNGSRLYAFAPDGTQRWVFESEESRLYPNWSGMYATPAIGGDGTIYISTMVHGTAATVAHLYAVRPDGTLKWSAPIPKHEEYPSLKPGSVMPWMVDRDNQVYGCADNARCYAFGPDGTLLWEYKTTPPGAWNRSTPILIRDGVLLILDASGVLHALADPSMVAQRAVPSGITLRLAPNRQIDLLRSVEVQGLPAATTWTAELADAPPWMQLVATTGTTPETINVRVTGTPARGVYPAKIRVRSDVPNLANPTLVIPVTVVVGHQVHLPLFNKDN